MASTSTTAWIPANVTIPDLPLGSTVSGTELFEAVQTTNNVANSVQLTLSQMMSTTVGALPSGGSAGQILDKKTSANFDTQWVGLPSLMVASSGISVVGSTTATISLATTAGISVLGVTGSTQTNPAPIVGASNQTLQVNAGGTSLAFGTLTVPGGGIGTTSLGAFGVAYGNGTSALDVASSGTSGFVLTSRGMASSPVFAAVNLTSAVTGVLGVPFGGTNTSTLTAFGVTYGNGTSTVGITAAGTTAWPLVGNGTAAAPSFAVLTVPGGGTGTTILTAHGVVLGEGTSVVGITAAGGTNFVLLGMGAANDPSFTGTPSIATSLAVGTTNSPGTGNIYAQGFFNSVTGFTRVATANFTAVASNTTLANITGLSAALVTADYDFEALVYATASSVGGAKIAIAYSGSVTNIIYQAVCYDGGISTTLLANNGRATASGVAIATCTAATVPTFRIIGNITATTPGNLTVQIAQAVAATQSTIVLGGSSLKVFQMN